MRRLRRTRRALAGALAAACLVSLGHAQPARKPKAGGAAPTAAPAAPATPIGDPITLAAVLEAAVRRSPRLAAATIDVEVARAEVVRATGLEDWLLTATGSYLRRREPSVEGELSTSRSERVAFDIGLARLLPTGGTVSLDGSLTRTESAISFMGVESESRKYTVDATLALDQPLLAGRGSTVTYAARSQAEHAARAVVLERQAVARDLVRDLIGAYWEVAFAQADLAIRRSSLELARERRRLTDAAVRLGQVAPTEVVAVDQIIAQREEEILGAELQVAERSLELRRLAGLEIGPRAIELSPGEPLAVEATPPTVDQVVAAAMEASYELAALEARGKGARLEIEVAENGTLPRLDLSLALGPIGAATRAPDAFESLTRFTTDEGGYSARAALRYQQALENRAAEGRQMRARAEARRIEIDGRQLRLEIALAAVQAVRAAGSAQKRMVLSLTAIELSEKNVKAETGRFELGKSTNFDVLERQEELKQARLRQARAVVDYLRALAFIDALTGDILGKYGVKLDER
jgi:outer membrane protein